MRSIFQRGALFGMIGAALCVAAVARAAEEGLPPAVVASSAPAVLSLINCFRLAVQHSEDLQISDQEIIQAHERYREAVGGILPNLHFLVAETIQDTTGVPANGYNQSERRQTQFSVTQPIFSGFKEFAGMKGAKAEERRERATRKRNATLLFQTVAQTFYDTVQLEADRANVQVSLKLTSDRVKELRGRERLGKSRVSEVIAAEGVVASQRAQDAQLSGAIDAARDTLSFFTGADLRATVLNDSLVIPADQFMEENFVRDAMKRADIQALREDLDAKREAIRYERAGYWPTLGAAANYYLERPGLQKEINWDILLDLDVPIYQGGTVSALVNQAISQARQSELALARLERQVTSNVRQAHSLFVASQRQTDALKEAYEKNRQSYEMQVKEYRYGLVNNLDVLVALAAMQQSKRDYDQAQAQVKLNWLALRTTIEDVPEPK